MNIEIPASAHVPCPQIAFKSRKVGKCLECPAFHGLTDTMPKSDAAFESRYRVNCAHPIARRLSFIEVE